VRGTEARSAEIDRGKGVALDFHVSLNKVEPSKSVRARNLLANDDARIALLDEMMESGPKVPLVSKPLSFACAAERLAWTTAGPDRPCIWPSGVADRVAPDSDPGKEMALAESDEVRRSNIDN